MEGKVGEGRKRSIRHAEKRRVGTCRFADRVAALSVQHYQSVVPEWFRLTQMQTCLATIIAKVENELFVLGLGVGTKFLSESTLNDPKNLEHIYGDRVRDCHAEVLARRAFRRHLSLEILRELKSARLNPSVYPEDTIPNAPRILQRMTMTTSLRNGDVPVVRYRLRDNVTVHFYCSSAPCGNAVLKKFATLQKESFRHDLRDDEWPNELHPHMPGHSIPLGQFALLCKKDNTNPNPIVSKDDGDPLFHSATCPPALSGKESKWPCHLSDSWSPPGTTTVWTNQGSLHTCSDKLARWNYLGLQGSLLASLLDHPLYISTLTVGRKLSAITCRRAVCCRLGNDEAVPAKVYHFNHPNIMGTSVYMDEDGIINMEPSGDHNRSPTHCRVESQDVRFHSAESWAWWPGMDMAECIDGVTGFCVVTPTDERKTQGFSAKDAPRIRSRVSSSALLELYASIIMRYANADRDDDPQSNRFLGITDSLQSLRRFKREQSVDYELAKEALLTRHSIFKHWKQRSSCILHHHNK